MAEADWIDGRARFQAFFEDLNRRHGRAFPTFRPTAEALHAPPGALPDEPVCETGGAFRQPIRLLLVPGFGASLLGRLGDPLPDAARHLRSLGVTVETLRVGGLASSKRNALLIERIIVEAAWPAKERIVLLGYSKGAMDALMALAERPGLARRVDALVSLAGSIGGSLLADDLPDPLVGGLHRVRHWLRTGGLWSLRRRRRHAWLRSHRLPDRVRLYTIVAHAPRDRISAVLRPSSRRLRRIDPKNDGQMLLRDQIVPGSTLLAELNCDHWAAALPLVRRWPWLRRLGLTANDFPREILLEAVLRVIDQDVAADPERPVSPTGSRPDRPATPG